MTQSKPQPIAPTSSEMHQHINQRRNRRRGGMARRQPIGKTVRAILVRNWVRTMVKLSAYVPICLRLAEMPLAPYKGKREILRYLGHRAYISPRAQISCANLHLAARCYVDDCVTIYAHPDATGEVYLAEDVQLHQGTTIELGQGGGSLYIGANTSLQAGCTLNPFISNIRIGANCMIATRCVLMPYQHTYTNPSLPMREQPLTSRGDIVIEDDVWLGAHVCIMDGVAIGKGAIVGAGAVVTRDIPPNSIAAGVPARVIRTRRDEESSPSHIQATVESLARATVCETPH